MPLRRFVIVFFLFSLMSMMYSQSFTHPGICITSATIARMKQTIANKEYPGYASFTLMQANTLANSSYALRGPYEYISRDDSTYKYTKTGMENDFAASYLNALMWVLTDNEAYAVKSRQILLAYANTLKGIPESNDAPLLAGLEGFKIISATELLRHTYSGFTADDFTKVKTMLMNYFIPILEKFSITPAYTNGNWGLIYAKGYMSAAILFDDRTMYNKAKTFYLSANDNGTIANYIDGATGQIQESGRDQVHCILGLGNMATICEMAWQQGDDLYSAFDNRFLKGCEYISRYNLGYDVPFRKWTDITGKYNNWPVVSSTGRGRFAPIFEVIYNHYVTRKGFSMPYTYEVLKRTRPEGYDGGQSSHGSLLFYEASPLPDIWEAGLIDECFYTNSIHNWTAATTGAILSIVNNQLKVDMVQQTDGSYRGDIIRTGGRTIHGGNYPILAIKIQGVNGNNLAFDTNKGPYGNGYGKWTGTIGSDIFYCDMTAQAFGGTNTFGNNDLWNLTTFRFKVAGITTGTSYTIDWIKTFPTMDSLNKFVANPMAPLSVQNNSYPDFRYKISGNTISLENVPFPCTIQLFDSVGRLLSTHESTAQNIELSGVSSGLKILNVRSVNKSKAIKIIVPRI